MKNISLFLVTLLSLALMTDSAWAASQIGLSHGTNKQRPELNFTPSASYHLQSAKNEWEPFIVLIRDDAGLTNVDVAVTAFTGPGDPITTLELYRAHYVPVPPDNISHLPPDPNMAGDWPDGLVPFVDHFVEETRSGAPFDVPAEFTQMVFVDLFVPENQAPGAYQAEVTVTANGMSPWTGTVTLEVWDFALPNGISLASNYGWSFGSVWNWHSAHSGTTDADTLNDYYMEEFARHRMSLYNWTRTSPAAVWNDSLQTFDWDWTEFDAVDGPKLDGTFYTPGYKFTGKRLPGVIGGRPGTVSAELWEQEYWGGWAEHFRDKGWDETLFYYMPDEPRPEMYPQLRDLAARLHAADPDLRPMVTEQYEEGLEGDVDIWCPDEPLFSDSFPFPPFPETYEDRRALGETTWWYNCVSAMMVLDYASHAVDANANYMRIWTWLTRRYGFTGILFWQTVYILGQSNDPWDSMYASPFFHGDGSVIFPGTVDRIGGLTDIPVASLRMKYLREAMEDYEYFHILDQAGDADWVDDVTRTVSPKTYVWEHDWSTLLGWRERVAQKILGTADDTPPAPPTDLTADGIEGGVYLEWTAPGDADLAGYDIWYALYDGDAFFGGTILDPAAEDGQIEGLTPKREYSLWIKAFDEAGNRSTASAIVTATPLDDLATDEDEASGDSNGDDEDGGDDENPNGVGVTSHGADDDSATTCGGW
jgi:glycosyl hydrolase family 123/fibronectin type III domain protein